MGLFAFHEVDLSKVDENLSDSVGRAAENLSDSVGRAAENLSDSVGNTIAQYTPGKIILGLVLIVTVPFVTIKVVDAIISGVKEQKHRVAHEHGVVRVQRADQ
eukprot:tig00000473_g1208.t1